MSLSFSQQLQLVSLALNLFFEGQQQITICVGAGASRGQMPMLARLISRAFNTLTLNDASRRFFETYSQRMFFAEALTRLSITSSNPVTLDEFRALDPGTQDLLCGTICDTYGEFFRDVQDEVGSKDRLLEILGFNEFRGGEPNPSHYYIAYLILEGKIQKIVTTNWDLLIERALGEVSPPSSQMELYIVRDSITFLNKGNSVRFLAKVHGCASQFPPSSAEIVLTTDDLQAAMDPNGWRQRILSDFLSGTTIFTGYSGSDYTVMVPWQVFNRERAREGLPHTLVPRKKTYLRLLADCATIWLTTGGCGPTICLPAFILPTLAHVLRARLSLRSGERSMNVLFKIGRILIGTPLLLR